jgi:CheY-like chemotaxis protein
MWSILIVDDEYGLAEIMADLLTAQGHTVATAINGKLALESLRQTRPDLILADLMMPVMPGDEMVRQLRRDPACRDIPVIMMSAAGFDELDADLHPHISGFLQKPFTFNDFMAELDRVLRTR